MIDSLSPYINIRSTPQLFAEYKQMQTISGSIEAREEFLTMFYKELLKQAFKTPDLSPVGTKPENNLVSSFGSDLMVEQLARELAKKYK